MTWLLITQLCSIFCPSPGPIVDSVTARCYITLARPSMQSVAIMSAMQCGVVQCCCGLTVTVFGMCVGVWECQCQYVTSAHILTTRTTKRFMAARSRARRRRRHFMTLRSLKRRLLLSHGAARPASAPFSEDWYHTAVYCVLPYIQLCRPCCGASTWLSLFALKISAVNFNVHPPT